MNKRLLLFSVACLGMVVSCIDDTEIMTPAVPSNTASDVVLSGTDLTRGVNVFISDNIGCDTIYLDTKQDVSLSYNEGSGIVFRQVRDEQGYTCLIPDVREANKSAVDEVMITTPDNQSKSVTVVLRYHNPVTRADALESRGYDALARGIPASSIEGVSDLYIFKKDLLEADTMLVPNTFVKESKKFEYHENSKERLADSFSRDFGIKASFPIKAAIVGLTGNYKENESTTTETEREYYMKVQRSYMAKYKLDFGRASYLHGDTLSMAYYLDNVLNDMLNNNKTNREYPRTKDGIYRLLNNYGAMYSDCVLLGGTATMIYSREVNLYQHNIKWDLSVALTVEALAETTSADAIIGDDKADAAAVKNLMDAIKMRDDARKEKAKQKKIEVDAAFGGTAEQYTNLSKAKLDVSLRGGNIGSNTNYDGWVPSDDPAKWVVVARDEFGKQDTEFCNLLKLVKLGTPIEADESIPDDQCTYAQLINRYFNQYMEDHKPKEKISKAPFVIADFLMISTGTSNPNIKKYVSEKGDDSRSGDYPKPFIMAGGADGVERMYYPIMMNNQDNDIRDANFLHGYALDTGCDSYICLSHKYSHLWYYAVDRADRCPGIVDIKVSSKSPGEDYVKRGDAGNDGVRGYTINHYVYLKFGKEPKYKKTKAKSERNYKNNEPRNGEILNKITGIALRCKTNNWLFPNHSKIIGATAGSDSPYPFNSTGNERLKKIWEYPMKNGWRRVGTQFYYSSAITNHPLYIEYTNEVFEDKDFHNLVIDHEKDDSKQLELNINKKNPSIPKTWSEY